MLLQFLENSFLFSLQSHTLLSRILIKRYMAMSDYFIKILFERQIDRYIYMRIACGTNIDLTFLFSLFCTLILIYSMKKIRLYII